MLAEQLNSCGGMEGSRGNWAIKIIFDKKKEFEIKSINLCPQLGNV